MATELEELLAAGAVLPLPNGPAGGTGNGPADGTDDAPADGTGNGPAGGTDDGPADGTADKLTVPLTARTYRHPVLDDRPVVRLVAADLGTGEDATAEFLGLRRVDEPVPVGLGQRQSLGFPEWVLVHHPEEGRQALAIVPELRRIADQARSKPKQAVEAYHALAGRLARSVPHFLPTFYEQAGRVLLAEQEESYAGQLFNRARKAEAEHGLPVDPDRLDEVYLEFALAGALSATALAGYAKELAARLPAGEALDRFCGLSVRGVAAGLVPAATLATTVRRLVRNAEKAGDRARAQARELAYLTDLISLPATLGATAWWKAHLPDLVRLAEHDRSVRGTLLNLMPRDNDEALPQWLEVLTRTGAVEGLVDPTLPADQRPADGTAGWLGRFLTARYAHRYRRPDPLPELDTLIVRLADQVRRELTASRTSLGFVPDLDLIDLLLSLGIPLDGPDDKSVDLRAWAEGKQPRDLSGVAGDERYRVALIRWLGQPQEHNRLVIRLLAERPGSRPLLAGRVREWARGYATAALPDLYDTAERLKALPREALALAPDEVAAATRPDLVGHVVRTLRGGLFDELGWPAWEEALDDVVGPGAYQRRIVADAWPHLVVAGPTRARVIDADGTLLCHDLRIPPGDSPWRDPGFHYVDGELLVYWHSQQHSYELRGYWHLSTVRDPQPMQGDPRQDDTVTLPLAGGGRTTGSGVLHVGDTEVPRGRSLLSDGTSYWIARHDTQGARWLEYDPVSGEHGRASLPAFLADALADAPAGSSLDRSSWLRPAPSAQVSPLGVPVDGLLGWRVVRLPDGSTRGEDRAGRRVTVPDRRLPVGALTLPGDDRPRALLADNSLVDPDGVVTAVLGSSKAYSPTTMPMPPRAYWHQLRARDPEGSAALRRIDRETVAALVKAALEQEATRRAREKARQPLTAEERQAADVELTGLVRAAIPQLNHEALVAGVLGVLRFAIARQNTFDSLTDRLRAAPAGSREEPVTGPDDQELSAALDGLGVRHLSTATAKSTVQQFRTLRRAIAATAPDPQPRLHLDGTSLPTPVLDWPAALAGSAAFAYRAAVATTPEPDRDALCALLAELDALDLVTVGDPARWRRLTLHVAAQHLKRPDGKNRAGHWRAVLPVAAGTFLACHNYQQSGAATPGYLFHTLYHDPSGAFEVPAPYTVLDSASVGDNRPAGWVSRFLAEYAARGPLPWQPAAVDRFVELTGVTRAVATLLLAGLPLVDTGAALDAETRKLLNLKTVEVGYARRQLHTLAPDFRRAVLAALLPDDPARLWTDGPDVARAAEVWVALLGRRPAIPELLLAEAVKEVQVGWGPQQSLPALLEPAASPELSTDLTWTVRHNRVEPVDQQARGFTAEILVGMVATAAWVAHHTAVGDPFRAALPAALAALRDRLANPDLLLNLGRYVWLDAFRQVAGSPTETGSGWERYGAVVLATANNRPDPGVLVALLDETGTDPFLPALRGGSQQMFPVEAALWLVRDAGFAALAVDPGDPVAGGRDPDGTWWPQDPTRSVPDLVAEVAAAHGFGPDAAATYLMLLAMPDPTDRNVARWTGWKPARLKAARAELGGTDLVVSATRARAGRSLFLPGPWLDNPSPRLPMEQWKQPLFTIPGQPRPPFDTNLPLRPAAELYRRAWQRLRDGDMPRLEELRNPARGRR
ncbi:hypothetical protein [Plantactinospora sp. B24E8]|uniref:hypothetical protein n=1 Tax=Plantactinospora sp. B24E8 TaxID=3153567 RepID=UPI00325F2678